MPEDTTASDSPVSRVRAVEQARRRSALQTTTGSATTTTLISPFGGRLVDLMVPQEELAEARAYASTLPSIQISARAVCDLEMMASGAFSPLDRFMNEADFRRVVSEMRLADGTLFPMPITLPVPADAELQLGSDIALRDSMNDLLAVMTVKELYPWDATEVAQKVFGTQDSKHPIVNEMARWGGVNASGKLRMLQMPRHYDFKEIRRTPAQTRSILEQTGRANVVAFQTRNPMHRVHEELTKRAIAGVDGVPPAPPRRRHDQAGRRRPLHPGPHLQALAQNYYEPDRIVLSLLPLAMRLGGPREALWHAIIRRNHGANHLVVGRDPRRPRQGLPRHPLLRPVRRPGDGQRARGRDGASRWSPSRSSSTCRTRIATRRSRRSRPAQRR
jgi:sulfate adenylyltransferase